MSGTAEEKSPNQWKEEGNLAFKNGDWDEALKCYTKALKLTKEENNDKALYLKNRAAVHLKKEDYEKAVKDCTDSLEIVPNDPKALFRRCQALESLERYEEAYRDARQIHTVDPGNKAIRPFLERLHAIVQERVRQNAQINNRVTQMFKLAFDTSEDKEKRETAMKNLVVLSREKSGSEVMYKEGVVNKIGKLLKVEQKKEIFVDAIRIIGELCKNNIERTKGILSELGLPWFLDTLNSKIESQVNSTQYCLQTILNTFTGMEIKEGSKPVKELCEKYNKEIESLLTFMLFSINSRTITGLARDAIIELLTRNVHYTAIDWAEQLVKLKGLEKLMEVASELEDIKYESAMDITSSTHTIIAVCFQRIYENMYYDEAKKRYLDSVDEYIKSKLLTPDIESKVRVTVALTTLLQGPFDVGDTIISREGMIEMILVMANSDDELQQRVACECIIAASSKQDKTRAIVAQGAHILKKLYLSKNDSIRIRALVGLCKLGSSGGTDASIRPFADGSTAKLAEACRRFLIKPSVDRSISKWAVEGLSYLTLDADVKEKLIEDKTALRAMFELARSGDKSATYGVVATLVNLVNAYDKQEVNPDLVELAKFAKHHIPEEHELDDPDFVAKRMEALAKEGVTSALVSLAKTDSPNLKELIARVFNALCMEKDLRGLVVQQGGVKALLPLALEGTDKGKKQAAQALARIGITMNPEVAFPGQRNVEVIRPLISLLHMDCNALENFEALMALCNLASMNETTRKRIIKEGGISKIDSYMYEEHEMLRRAATQTITNMVMSPDVVKLYEGENDRVKFLVLLCCEEDLDTALAAAGALAMLTSCSKKVCRKFVKVSTWLDSLRRLLADPDLGLQHRGVAIVKNMMESCKDVAEHLISTDIMEILMATTLVNEEGREKIKTIAEEALQAAVKWKLIKERGENDNEGSDSDVN